MLREVARQHAERPALMIPTGKEFETLTYRTVWERVASVASSLHAMGLQRGDRMVILGENSGEWLVAHYAAQSLGAITVPIYPTLPADQAEYIARDSGAKLALCASKEHAAKLSAIEGLRVEQLKEALPAGNLDEAAWNAGMEAHDPTEVCILIYTSGTTGQPKGAMLSSEAFLTVNQHAKPYLFFDENTVLFDFLPLSHVFEQIATCLVWYGGGCIGMNKNLASLANDFTSIRPTAMAAVPRFLEAFMDRVLDSMKKQPPMKQKLFAMFLAQGVKRAQGGFAPLYGLLDKLVGAKIRERLGGRLQTVISGGAALPKHVAEFYLALRIDILQGYGLTETTGGSCVNHRTRNKYWTVGEPLGVELKIAPDGEILFRGPTVMKGYYNLPEATAEAIDADGWFHTGDIGEMEGPALKITDRKKDILVLGNGKNVAPLPIENRIRESRFVSEVVVLGDGMDHCVALLLPQKEAVRAELGLPEDVSFASNDAVRALFKKELDKVNKQIAHFEMVKKFAVLDDVFTIDNGFLTPKMSIKRKVVKEKYAELISSLG